LKYVKSDLIHNVDVGRVTALVTLYLSAASDTTDHTILLNDLENRFSVHRLLLDRFHSCLSDRWQTFCTGGSHTSEPPVFAIALEYSVLQGSVLSPVKFITYTEDKCKKTVVL